MGYEERRSPSLRNPEPWKLDLVRTLELWKLDLVRTLELWKLDLVRTLELWKLDLVRTLELWKLELVGTLVYLGQLTEIVLLVSALLSFSVALRPRRLCFGLLGTGVPSLK